MNACRDHHSPAWPSRRRALSLLDGQHGFTLMEIALVLVIIGVLAAVAAPRLQEAGLLSQIYLAEEVRVALRYAQRQAVASGCAIEVDLSTNRYELLYLGAYTTTSSPPKGIGHNQCASKKLSLPVPHDIPDSRLSISPVSALRFHPDGQTYKDDKTGTP
ncbi:MAG: pilin protein MshC, partial [Pseudomonadota bacterium]|nr:pilin protein MshC [Pseudomonadota bacterium]